MLRPRVPPGGRCCRANRCRTGAFRLLRTSFIRPVAGRGFELHETYFGIGRKAVAELITEKISEHIIQVRINRPERLNALNIFAARTLQKAVEEKREGVEEITQVIVFNFD